MKTAFEINHAMCYDDFFPPLLIYFKIAIDCRVFVVVAELNGWGVSE
jgi:hypothetical protein